MSPACGKPFTLTERKHHRRGCGKLLCKACLNEEKSCATCSSTILAKRQVKASEFAFGQTKVFVRSPEVIFAMQQLLEQKHSPASYEAKAKEFQDIQKVAQRRDTGGLKIFCLIM